MRIEGAEIGVYKGKTAIVLQAPKRDIQAFLEKFETKYPIEVDITPKKRKRSLNANAYAWILCDRIASEVGITKEEVYRSHIREVGVFEDIRITANAVPDFCKKWESIGVGWVTEVMYVNEHSDFAEVRAYYGSSTYDSKQMARLIDNIIHEAKQLGVETLTHDELERMKQAWSTR